MRSILTGGRAATAVLTLFVAVSAARAGDLTGFVGGVKPGSLSISGLKTSLDGSPVFGLRLSGNFVPMLGHEHTLGFSSDYLYPRSTRAFREAKGFVYSSNLIVSLPSRRVIPYATGGVGIIHQYGDEDLPIGTKFAVNYGGGLKIPRMFGPLGLRFDARGYTAMGLFSSKLTMLEVSAGLLISFGH
jgi:hypothetical protein